MSEHTKYNVLFVFLYCIQQNQMYNHVADREREDIIRSVLSGSTYCKEMEA